MDNSFLSPQNIDNIFEYINAEMVKNHNIDLTNDTKNKKIIKKLTKTVYDKVQADINNGVGKKNIVINNFNDMVVKKCVPFLLNKTKVKNTTNKERKKPRKYSVKKQMGVKNIDLDIGEAPTNYKSNDFKNAHDSTKSQFQEYINNANDFEQLVKVSNKQINDSFNAYSQKESVFNSHDSINSSCNSDITSDFIIDRCATKDDVDSGRLNKSAFNDIFSQAVINSKKTKMNNSSNNRNSNNSNTLSSSPQAYENYGQLNVRDLLSKVLINQQDHSNNEVETYDGELYLPNLIREVGEEAPIQPLLYQNTKQGDERLHTKVIMIDTGNSDLDLTSEGSPLAVTNLGTKNWYKFRINLQETFKIDKLTDIYIKSFTLFGATPNNKTADATYGPGPQYYVVNIEELNIIRPSNNKHLKDRLVFKNTATSQNDTSTVAAPETNFPFIVSHDYPYKSYYVASINPDTLYNLTFELTNENGDHVDLGDYKTFKSQNATTNRLMIEFELYPRDKPNEIVFDRTPYGSALNAELSNT